MSYIEDWTEEELKALERKLDKQYREAWKDLNAKARAYFLRYAKRWEKEYKAYQDGKYTTNEFRLWEQSQLARGQHWDDLRDKMAERLTNTNVIAASYIEDAIINIYCENYNYAAYTVEGYAQNYISNIQMGADFDLMNEAVLRRLILKNPRLLPLPSVDIPKDQQWNKKKLQACLMQSILQGEGIGRLADRFQQVAAMNRASAIRSARTATTSAQNGGTYEAYTAAEKIGIQIQDEWIATHDYRTRDSHRALDGTRVKHGERFANGLRFPGDMLYGTARELYNCRCTTRAIISGINDADPVDLSHWSGGAKEYEAWKRGKRR